MQLFEQVMELISYKSYTDFMYNLTYGQPLQTSKFIGPIHGGGWATHINRKMTFPPIYAMLDMTSNVETVGKIAQKSGQYLDFDETRYYSGEVNIEDTGLVFSVQNKFLGYAFMSVLGRLDSSGIFQRWHEQYLLNVEKLALDDWCSQTDHIVNPNSIDDSREKFKSLNLEQIAGFFAIIVVGVGLAGISLVLERTQYFFLKIVKLCKQCMY
jgi:hypothetical protein